MFSMFFLPKYSVRFIVVVFLFITVVLQAFLLLGCIKTSSTYSSIYLTQYKFNSSSPVYSKVQAGFKANGTDLAAMSIKAGYMSFCATLGTNVTCTSYSSAGSISAISGVSLLGNSTELNLGEIVQKFSEVCHPRILMASCIMVMLSIVILCYSSIPLMPGRLIATKACLALNTVNILLWGLGSMLSDEAVSTSKSMVGPASMGVVSATAGSRAMAMTWVSFSFICVVTVGCVYLVVIDTRRVKKQQEPVKKISS